MRATRHNGRVGKHGGYNPNHNDRQFNLEHSDHIDEERTPFNIYWDCIQGFTTHDQRADLANGILTFDDVEDIFYAQRYAGYVEGQDARNEKVVILRETDPQPISERIQRLVRKKHSIRSATSMLLFQTSSFWKWSQISLMR